MFNTKHPDYMVWRGLRRRCTDKSRKEYHSYGAKGVDVDVRWKDFRVFLADMGPRPDRSYSIDRIDNSKGYSKENCRWVTRAEQTANRRIAMECVKGHPWDSKNVMLADNGKKKVRRCRICYEARIGKKQVKRKAMKK